MKTYLISEKILNEIFYFLVEEVHSEFLIKRLDDLRNQLENLEEVEHDYLDRPIYMKKPDKNIILKTKE